MILLKTVDGHVGGSAQRLLVEGFPAVPGASMSDKLAWARAEADELRRFVMCEPRGHAGMHGVVLTEGATADAHAGALFMDADGFHAVSFEGVMAAAVIAVATGLIVTTRREPLAFDTAIGLLRVDVPVDASADSGTRVSLTGVPSFVSRGGIDVTVGTRQIRADIAYGGAFHAIVDSESAGIPIDGTRDAELQRMARGLSEAVAMKHRLIALDDSADAGLRGVIFTGPAQQDGADFRAVAVTARGRIDRSPSGTAVAAILAVLNAMGLPIADEGITLEGVVGTRLTGRIAKRVQVGEVEAVIPQIDAMVWPTGDHAFVGAVGDPVRGFVID